MIEGFQILSGSPAKTSRTGILLVGHGTRDPEGTREFFELADRLAERASDFDVQGCLLEFQHPNIEEGWQRLVDRGVERICVAPLLLFAAGHARSDIPELTAKCAVRTPGIEYWQSTPLSRALPLVERLTEQVCSVADRNDIDLDRSVGLVLVGRGSHHPCATTDMLCLGEIVAHRIASQVHRVGFYAMAEPRLPRVLDDVASRNGIQAVIVQPHLLFQGRLYDAIKKQVQEASQRHPNVRFVLGDYLGPCDQVADALLHRVDESRRRGVTNQR